MKKFLCSNSSKTVQINSKTYFTVSWINGVSVFVLNSVLVDGNAIDFFSFCRLTFKRSGVDYWLFVNSKTAYNLYNNDTIFLVTWLLRFSSQLVCSIYVFSAKFIKFLCVFVCFLLLLQLVWFSSAQQTKTIKYINKLFEILIQTLYDMC